MNVSEATATQEVIDWITSLTVWEAPDCAVADDDLLTAVRVLARRAHARLGAGPDERLVHQRMLVVLGEVPPTGGAR